MRQTKIAPLDLLAGRYPDAVIAGAKKCGTGAFQHMLVTHSVRARIGLVHVRGKNNNLFLILDQGVVRASDEIEELHFFDFPKKFARGWEGYKEQLSDGVKK